MYNKIDLLIWSNFVILLSTLCSLTAGRENSLVLAYVPLISINGAIILENYLRKKGLLEEE